MTALVRYEAARHALQIAKSVDEVKDIRDKAQAMAAYARQAKDTALVEWATEIKVRAERKAGELTRELEKNPGKRKDLTSPHDAGRLKGEILAEAGISTQTASRWEKLAAVPEDQFEQAVAAAKEVAGEVTTAAMLKVGKPPIDKPKAPETVPAAEHAALVEKHAELVAELETYVAISNGDTVKEMNLLRQLLKQAQTERDHKMREAVELRKQNERLNRELKKLGWTGFKKVA